MLLRRRGGLDIFLGMGVRRRRTRLEWRLGGGGLDGWDVHSVVEAGALQGQVDKFSSTILDWWSGVKCCMFLGGAHGKARLEFTE